MVSLASVSFGAHLAQSISPHFPALSPPGRALRYSLTVISVLIYFATIPAYFSLPVEYRHQATAALLFSFPGTLTRYLLSIRLNPLINLIPLGTFTANILGTALLGTFHVLQKHSRATFAECLRYPAGFRGWVLRMFNYRQYICC